MRALLFGVTLLVSCATATDVQLMQTERPEETPGILTPEQVTLLRISHVCKMHYKGRISRLEQKEPGSWKVLCIRDNN